MVFDGASTAKSLPKSDNTLWHDERLHSAPQLGDSRITNAFCVTLYNEDLVALKVTLTSLVLAIAECHKDARHRRDRATICVVVDGHERVHADTRQFLVDEKWISFRPAGPDQTELHSTSHQPGPLLRTLGYLGSVDCLFGVEPIQVIVCLKPSNCGKLHSHHLFFDVLCRQLRPTYCYQVDTGTAVTCDTVLKLSRRMEEDCSIAAIAPRVMPAVPSHDASFLLTWQYSDFAFRKSIYWPVEASTKFLSVIPGQVGIFRWKALYETASYHDQTKTPIDAYLRGLHATDPVERIMYLAEDRVIASEIGLAEGHRWKLDYMPDATATTDSCQSLLELFRQRRRWNNSSMTCRYWLLTQWRNLVSRPSHKRLDFTVPMAAQLLIGVREFLSPALLIALIMALLSPSNVRANSPAQLLWNAYWLIIAAEIPFLLLGSLTRHRALSRLCGRAHFILGWLGAALFVAMLLTAFSTSATALLLAPGLAAIPALLLVLPRFGVLVALKAQFSPISNLMMSNALLIYGLSRLDDVSWGTKGLVQSKTSFAPRLRHMRNRVLGIWAVANLSVILCAWRLPGMFSSEMNPVIELACLMDVLLATCASGYLLLRRIRIAARVRD